MGVFLVLASITAAPTAHGEGLHTLLEPLLFVVVALGLWLFARYQSRQSSEPDQENPPHDE